VAEILSARAAAFADAAAARPFFYGRFDCALFAADWGRELTGLDGAADLRGRYRTALGCARVLKREGGLTAVVARCATTIGFVAVSSPCAGDVAVIAARTPAGDDLACALALAAGRWAALSTRGVCVLGAHTHALHVWGLR